MTTKRFWAVAAVVGQVAFTAGWLVTGAIEGHGYSVARHDSSDLVSRTAHHPWLLLSAQAFAGVLTVGFLLLVLRPALRDGRGRGSFGPWLVACSLVGAELVEELYGRPDCRAADAGCTQSVRYTSASAHAHMIVGFVAVVALVAAPFVLARRMRRLPAWQDLARPAMVLGGLLLASAVAYVVTYECSLTGYLNRAPLLLGSIGVVALAVRTLRLGNTAGCASAPTRARSTRPRPRTSPSLTPPASSASSTRSISS